MRLIGTAVTVAWALTAPVTLGAASAEAAQAAQAAQATQATQTGPQRCHGRPITIVGTHADDQLRGTSGPDVIAGRRGDDVITGLAGDDTICGGRGADVLDGGDGDDRVFGDLDHIGSGGAHRADSLTGGPGDDVLDGGYDDRTAIDAVKVDTISWSGSAHAVQVDLTAGTAAGQGRDRVTLVQGRVRLTRFADDFVGSSGRDLVHGGGGGDRIALGGGDDFAITRAGSDVVDGGDGDDLLQDRGLAGEDRILGGPGADDIEDLLNQADGQVLDGGDEADVLDEVRFRQASGPTPQVSSSSWDMASGTLLMHAEDGSTATATVRGFEWGVIGGFGAEIDVSGTEGPDYLAVWPRTDFRGLGGDDRFWGSPGEDTFDGGDGDDTYLYDHSTANVCSSVENDPEGYCGTP